MNLRPGREGRLFFAALPFALVVMAYFAASAARLAVNPDDKLLPWPTAFAAAIGLWRSSRTSAAATICSGSTQWPACSTSRSPTSRSRSDARPSRRAGRGSQSRPAASGPVASAAPVARVQRGDTRRARARLQPGGGCFRRRLRDRIHPTSFLRLAGIPFEGTDAAGTRLCLLRVELEQVADMGVLTPHIGGGSFRYDPLPAKLVSRRRRLRLIYLDGSGLQPLNLGDAKGLAPADGEPWDQPQ